MSDTPEQLEAKRNLEDAIVACAVAYGGEGEILTAWEVTASLTNGALMDTDSTAYLRLTPSNGQPFHSTMGLLVYHLDHLRHAMFKED